MKLYPLLLLGIFNTALAQLQPMPELTSEWEGMTKFWKVKNGAIVLTDFLNEKG